MSCKNQREENYLSPCHHSFGLQRHTRFVLFSFHSALLACPVVFYTPKTPWGLPVVLDMFSFACVVFVSWHFFPLTERRSCVLPCTLVKREKKKKRGGIEKGKENILSTFQSTHKPPLLYDHHCANQFFLFLLLTDPFDHRLCTAHTGSFQRNWIPSQYNSGVKRLVEKRKKKKRILSQKKENIHLTVF